MKSLPILTQTYWSDDPKVCLLPDVLELSHLLPKPGERRRVFIARQNKMVGETQYLLWQPPISELNGLYEQPSDLAAAMVIECSLRFLQHEVHRSFGEGCAYDAEIVSIRPIVEFALSIPQTTPAEFYEYPWRQKNRYMKARVGDCLWLWCFPQEAFLEALIKIETDGWRLLYHSDYCDGVARGTENSSLMNALLDAEQTTLFMQVAEQASTAKDLFPDYLIHDCNL